MLGAELPPLPLLLVIPRVCKLKRTEAAGTAQRPASSVLVA